MGFGNDVSVSNLTRCTNCLQTGMLIALVSSDSEENSTDLCFKLHSLVLFKVEVSNRSMVS